MAKKDDKGKKPEAAYVANKTEVNKDRRIKKQASFIESCKDKKGNIKTPKGTGRAKRREAAKSSGIQAQSFPEKWSKFREVERDPTLLTKFREPEPAAATAK